MASGARRSSFYFVTREETDLLIQQLEKKANQDPKGYTVRVGLWAAFGYGYLVFTLLLTLAATAAIAYFVILNVYYVSPNQRGGVIKLGIILGVLVGGLGFAILKALRIRMEPPHGIGVTRQECPELFAALDDIHRRLRSARPHEVLVSADLNACVVQIPRLGVFGWQKKYLVMGLPLMQALAPEECRSVLAHEFAHLSRNHARFGAWIYRIRRTWEGVFEQLARQRSADFGVLSGFLKWYWPRFNARAFVLARANEYEADACAAELTSAGAAASALMRIRVLAEQFEESFWPSIYKQANEKPEPPEGVFAAGGQMLRAGPGTDETARWLKQSFLVPTNNLDTHPCLKERLRALGALPPGVECGEYPSSLPPIGPQTSAEFYLGRHIESLQQELSKRWRQEIAEIWKARHAEAKQLAEKLSALPENAQAAEEATVEQLWEKAVTLQRLDGDAAALPVLEQILARDPNHAAAHFIRGRHYVSADDPRGVEHLERAMTLDETLVLDGVNLMYGHFSRTGQKEKLRSLELRADAHYELIQKANRERGTVTAADNFLPAELKPSDRKTLLEVCGAEPEIQSVAVARKEVRYLPKLPLFVVCLRLNVSWWSFRSSTANQKLVHRVLERLRLSAPCVVFVAEGNLKPLGRKIAAVPDAQVYQRAKQAA